MTPQRLADIFRAAVCEECKERHYEAMYGAPWQCVPRCRRCWGLLVFPTDIPATKPSPMERVR